MVTLVACDWGVACGAGNCNGRNVSRMDCGSDERRGDCAGRVAKRGWVRVRPVSKYIWTWRVFSADATLLDFSMHQLFVKYNNTL